MQSGQKIRSGSIEEFDPCCHQLTDAELILCEEKVVPRGRYRDVGCNGKEVLDTLPDDRFPFDTESFGSCTVHVHITAVIISNKTDLPCALDGKLYQLFDRRCTEFAAESE